MAPKSPPPDLQRRGASAAAAGRILRRESSPPSRCPLILLEFFRTPTSGVVQGEAVTNFVMETRRELSRSLPLRSFPERPPCMLDSLVRFRSWPTYTFLYFSTRFPRHRLIPPKRFPTNFPAFGPAVTGGEDFGAIRFLVCRPVGGQPDRINCCVAHPRQFKGGGPELEPPGNVSRCQLQCGTLVPGAKRGELEFRN